MANTDLTSDESLMQRLGELEQETDAEFVLELVDIFLSESPKLIEAIAASLHTQDYPNLKVSAHTLKGSSLNIGAKNLGTLCLGMEQLGRNAQPIPPGTSTNDIEAEFTHLKEVLAGYKKSKGA